MNELMNGVKTISSREVAEMMEVSEHSKMLRKIDDISAILNQSKIGLVDYWTESTYLDAKGETRREYQVTKKGCELLAHKSTGEKGVIFTVKYMERFEAMEKAIQQPQDSYMIEDPIARAKRWIEEQEEKKALEEKNKLITARMQAQQPLVKLAKDRIDKNGSYTITEATTAFGLKRGQITAWAKQQGFLHKTHTEVNQKGKLYFKIFDNNGYPSIGITKAGMDLINVRLVEVAQFKKPTVDESVHANAEYYKDLGAMEY